MGKGAEKPNSSEQEVLNSRRDAEKDCSWGSSIEKMNREGSCSSRVFVPVCVVLVLLVFSLLVALIVVLSGPSLPHPAFSHVCPDKWLGFQGKCYHFSETESDWMTSQENCKALGASLALINTMEEMAFIKRYKGEANHWFGLRKGEDDSWWWANGTAFNNWFEVRGGAPCAYLNQERISSSFCHTKKNWLCSRPDDYVLWKQKAYP